MFKLLQPVHMKLIIFIVKKSYEIVDQVPIWLYSRFVLSIWNKNIQFQSYHVLLWVHYNGFVIQGEMKETIESHNSMWQALQRFASRDYNFSYTNSL